MPLINASVPSRDCQQTTLRIHSQNIGKQNIHEVDVHYMDCDIESSVLNHDCHKEELRAPAVPQRSERRNSRMLDSLIPEIERSALKEDYLPDVADPHELYLSSEEDASYSDYDAESFTDLEQSPVEEGNELSSRASRLSNRRSQEVTATLVSFITVGKPQIVEIQSNNSSPQKPALQIDTFREARRPAPPRLSPRALRRLSVTSVSSITSQYLNTPTMSLSNEQHPPRKSSKFSSLVTSTKHAFLYSDPYPADEPAERAETPKTPITVASAAWKSIGLKRTLSKARKPSMAKLSSVYDAALTLQEPSAQNLYGQKNVEEVDPWKQRQRSVTTPAITHEETVICEGVMSVTGGLALLQEKGKDKESHGKFSLSMRGLTKRKSVKGR